MATPDEARAAVRKVKAMGADFVKVYTGLGPESLVAVAGEAKRQQLRLTGHPGGHFTMLEISDLGMDIEHVFPTMGFASTRDELSLVRPPSGQKISPFSLEGARIVVEQYDADAVRNLITRFLKNRTTLTPTLHAQWSTVLAPVLADKRRSHLMPRWLETWNDRGAVPSVVLDPLRRKAKQIDARVTSELKAGGVTILAGSDTGASNQNLYPGSILHAELVEFVEAGISPLQTIKAATLDAARWLGRDKELGSIAKGKLADLVLLDANPLDDIRNTLKIRAVVANGKLLDRSQLDTMLGAAQSGVCSRKFAAGRSEVLLSFGRPEGLRARLTPRL